MAPQIKPSEILDFQKALARWYKTHGRRDLPWRNTDNPYHIWVSEVMLQQTQVKTVLERYYFPFLKTFPTVEALAAAPRERVLKAWEGLGYYTRARNLHEAAKRLLREGGLPARPLVTTSAASWLALRATHPTAESLLALPGIGRNTANAILAFAYHHPVPVLEANVKRVIARILALKTPRDEALWRGADMLLNRKHPFDYNQAMMDLGALVCTPRAPRCGECPARFMCKGKHTPECYPEKKPKKSTPTRHVIIEVIEDAAGRLYLESRSDRLLGGLYGFPQKPVVAKLSSNRSHHESSIGQVTHTYSHFKLIAEVHYTRQAAKKNSADWHGRDKIAKLPLSKLDHKVLALVENRHSTLKKRPKAQPGA